MPSDLGYGEVRLDSDEDPGSLDLGELPIEPKGAALPAPVGQGGADLPAPAGGIDLPAPADSIGLPAPSAGITDLPAPSAGITDLPAPSAGITDLPAPSAGVDLPAPSPNVGLPAPSAGVDLPAPSPNVGLPAPSPNVGLPAPSQGVDLPAPSPGVDLPAPSARIDLPGPVEPSLPGGTIDLPGPHWKTGTDVVAPKPDEEEIIRFEAPVGQSGGLSQPAAAAGTTRTALAPTTGAKKGIGRLPLIIGGSVLGVGAVVALLFVFGIFGGSGKRKGNAALQNAHKQLALDTLVGYRDAASGFSDLLKKDADNHQLRGLAAQAIAMSVVRFGGRAKLGRLRQVLKPTKDLKEPPIEIAAARGVALLARNNAKGAVSKLASLSKKHPQQARLAAYLGWAHHRAGNSRAAQAAWRQALAADGKLTLALHGMALLADHGERSKEALRLAQKAVASSPSHAAALLIQIKHLVLTGKKELADKLLLRVDGLAKRRRLSRADHSSLHVRHAELAMRGGRINEARTRYGEALKANARNLDAHLGLGQLFLRARQHKKALDHLRIAHTQKKGSVRIGMLVARANLALGKTVQARTGLMQLSKVKPGYAPIYNLLGAVELAAQNDDKAIAAFKTAIDKDKKYLEPYLQLSRLYLAKKRTQKAFSVLEKAFLINKDPRVLNAIGETHRQLNQPKKAQQQFEKALELDPNLNIALFNLARIQREQNDNDAAFKTLEKLRKKDDSYPGINGELGAVLLALKKPQLAAQAYGLALASHQPTIALRIDAGYAFAAAGKYQLCLKQANEVLKDPRKAADARALRALAYFGMKKYLVALSENNQSLEREKRPAFYVMRGRILEKMGRSADALVAYRSALRLAPKSYDLMLNISRLLVRADAVNDGLRLLERLIAARPKLAEAHFLQRARPLYPAQREAGDCRPAKGRHARSHAWRSRLSSGAAAPRSASVQKGGKGADHGDQTQRRKRLLVGRCALRAGAGRQSAKQKGACHSLAKALFESSVSS
jgi:tetratricopeptide (TPR) repeat protein